jgi:O-antigen ligase
MNREMVLAAKFLALTAFLVTILISFSLNSDPINPIKLMTLVVGGFGSAALLISRPRLWTHRATRLTSSAVLLFLVCLVLALLANSTNLNSRFFGEYGRNTGFLAYLALALIFLTAAVFVTQGNAHWISFSLIATGAVNVIYGLFQLVGLDPGSWENPYNEIIGTLGNPNFFSALAALSVIMSFAFVAGKELRKSVKVFLLTFIAVSLFLIVQSDSSQGLGIVAIGVAITVYQKIKGTPTLRYARAPFLVTVAVGGFFSVLGLLQKGPLASLVYQESVTYRGDYWRAGIAMVREKPWFGMGLDSYGDYYRAYRSSEAVLRRGPEVVSNSAHNVFIDIAVSGGLFLLAGYLLLIGLAMRSAIRIMNKAGSFQWVTVGLVSTWIGYLAQSSISINQLGLAVWGWLLPGAIIGIDTHNEVSSRNVPKFNFQELSKKKTAIFGALGAAMGLSVSLWPFLYDVNMTRSFKSNDPNTIEKAVVSFPQNNYQLITVALIFQQNGFEEEAMSFFRTAHTNNPRDFAPLLGLYRMDSLEDSERAQILEKLKVLDPLNDSISRG